jgi:hypothetical protein
LVGYSYSLCNDFNLNRQLTENFHSPKRQSRKGKTKKDLIYLIAQIFDTDHSILFILGIENYLGRRVFLNRRRRLLSEMSYFWSFTSLNLWNKARNKNIINQASRKTVLRTETRCNAKLSNFCPSIRAIHHSPYPNIDLTPESQSYKMPKLLYVMLLFTPSIHPSYLHTP